MPVSVPQLSRLSLVLCPFYPAWLPIKYFHLAWVQAPQNTSWPLSLRFGWLTVSYHFPRARNLKIGLGHLIFSPFTLKSVIKSWSFCIGLFQICISSHKILRYFPNLSLSLCPFPFRKSSTLPGCLYFSYANPIIIVLLNFLKQRPNSLTWLDLVPCYFTIELIYHMWLFLFPDLMLYACFYDPWLWFFFLFVFYHYFIFYGLFVWCRLPKREMTGL